MISAPTEVLDVHVRANTVRPYGEVSVFIRRGGPMWPPDVLCLATRRGPSGTQAPTGGVCAGRDYDAWAMFSMSAVMSVV